MNTKEETTEGTEGTDEPADLRRNAIFPQISQISQIRVKEFAAKFLYKLNGAVKICVAKSWCGRRSSEFLGSPT